MRPVCRRRCLQLISNLTTVMGHCFPFADPPLWVLSIAGGRYLGDVWVLDLDTLTWTPANDCLNSQSSASPPPSSDPATTPPPPPPPFPSTAGHVLLPWEGNILSIGGHTKVQAALL